MDKEKLKALRKAAYQKAKADRENDPEYQAMKAKVKEERKARYKAYKQQLKDAKEAARIERQRKKDQELMEIFNLKEKLQLLKFD
ncbi:MAG: hypothetical protein KC505_07655 [Myxococcales bacterium]|nr:hypothetical protein [Myxococcales bacterium]USN50093.1 MAG: hypothetical protein H6731_07420 [Myxococcales bacterium]